MVNTMQNKFKEGDKVKCINPDIKTLKRETIYIVIKYNELWKNEIYLKGVEYSYRQDRFELVK